MAAYFVFQDPALSVHVITRLAKYRRARADITVAISPAIRMYCERNRLVRMIDIVEVVR